jgi:hypothetical protein
MTEDLVLPVPDTLPAMYLVPVSMPDAQAQRVAQAAVARRVAEPLRSLTRRLIGTPALAVALRPLSAFSSLSAQDLASDDSVASDETEFVAFAAMTPPRPGPVHEWVTRAASAAFAAELDLPIVDAFARRVLSADGALSTLPGAPRLTDVDGGFRLADWVTVQRAGQCLTTKGFGRFGLPELKVDHVPPEAHPSWTIALTGLGHRLLDILRCELRRGEAPFVQVPAQIEISRTDVAAAYGVDLREDGAGLPVRLSLDLAITDELESYLSVDSPRDQPAGEHRLALQATLFGPGTGTARRASKQPRTGASAARAQRARLRFRGVLDLARMTAGSHDPGGAQNAQVLRHERLADAERLHQLMHRLVPIGQLAHDPEPHGRSQRLEKLASCQEVPRSSRTGTSVVVPG